MNLQILNQIIKKSGMSKVFIADKLNISYQTLLNKLAGVSEFKVSELWQIKELLHLSEKQMNQIIN